MFLEADATRGPRARRQVIGCRSVRNHVLVVIPMSWKRGVRFASTQDDEQTGSGLSMIVVVAPVPGGDRARSGRRRPARDGATTARFRRAVMRCSSARRTRRAAGRAFRQAVPARSQAVPPTIPPAAPRRRRPRFGQGALRRCACAYRRPPTRRWPGLPMRTSSSGSRIVGVRELLFTVDLRRSPRARARRAGPKADYAQQAGIPSETGRARAQRRQRSGRVSREQRTCRSPVAGTLIALQLEATRAGGTSSITVARHLRGWHRRSAGRAMSRFSTTGVVNDPLTESARRCHASATRKKRPGPDGSRLLHMPTAVPLLAERNVAHRRQDAVDDQLLELRLPGEPRAVGERLRVVAQRSHPRTAAVVVLTPGDRMESRRGRDAPYASLRASSRPRSPGTSRWSGTARSCTTRL